MNDELNKPFGEVTEDERNLALIMHLVGGLFGFVSPLIFWLVKKDDSRFIDQHGKEALNFHLSTLIYIFGIALIILVPLFVLTFLTMGLGLVILFPVLLGVVGFSFVYLWVCCTLAAMQASRGETCRYPLTISFIK